MGAVDYRSWNRVLLAAAAVGVLSGVPRPANAQLRSLHAVRYIKLDPPTPQAENLHRQLTAWLQLYLRLVEFPESLPAEEPKWSWSEPGPRSRFAHCALRTDLSAPQKIGLECSDYAGHYIGTVRFADEGELRRWVDELVFNQPVARPLSAVRSIFVGPISGDRHNIVEYVRELLRARVGRSTSSIPTRISRTKQRMISCGVKSILFGAEAATIRIHVCD